jgi:hypothetical protein
VARMARANVGTECILVHCSLYTGCICRALNPREPRNQVVNLQNIAILSTVNVVKCGGLT